MVRLLALIVAAVAAVAATPAEAAALRSSVCHISDFETPVRCVEVDVPLDYAEPAGPSITLTAAIVPATTGRPAQDPLFVFAGGPGQAATGYGAWLETAFGPARRARDVVLLDFRGTGRSGRARLRCARFPRVGLRCRRAARGAGVRARARAWRRVLHAPRSRRGHRASAHGARCRPDQSWGGSFGTRIAQHYVRSTARTCAASCSTARHRSARRSSRRHRIRLRRRCERLLAIAQPTLLARARSRRSPADFAALLARAETGTIGGELRRPTRAA